MGSIVNASERRCEHLRNYVSGRGGIRWRGFAQGAPTATELSKLTYSLRRSCIFDDDFRRTGCIEYRGRRVTFEVTDSALIVTQTGETMEPRSVARMRPMVELEQQRRAAERAQHTERHRRRWKR
jgi:hypothetical protein